MSVNGWRILRSLELRDKLDSNSVFVVRPFMKIVISGGSGQVGTLLARAFIKDGHQVTVLSRSPKTAHLADGRMGCEIGWPLVCGARRSRRGDQSSRS